MTKTYDVAVAWRIYPGVSKTPIIHSDNKLALVRTSLKSFKLSVGNLRVSYFFILDGCPPQYTEIIEQLFAAEKYTVLAMDKVGNFATFGKQIELLLGQNDSDAVYFAEDDYLYRPGKFVKALEMLKKDDVDFVSTYTHMDVFTHPIHDHPRKTKLVGEELWFTASSTCLTFLTSKKVLEETKKIFYKFVYDNIYDCSLWLIITKEHMLSRKSWNKLGQHDECKRILKKAVKKGSLSYYTTRKYFLWMPLHAIATHLEEGLESPFIDWKKLAGEIEIS